MANEKGVLTAQWALGIAGAILGTVALIAWQGIAGDVKANSEHRTTQEGARLNQRLCDVEKGVEWLRRAQDVAHNEDKHTRRLLNAIAAERGVAPAPEVADLPPEPEPTAPME